MEDRASKLRDKIISLRTKRSPSKQAFVEILWQIALILTELLEEKKK